MSNYLGLDPSTKSTGWAVINKKKDLLLNQLAQSTANLNIELNKLKGGM